MIASPELKVKIDKAKDYFSRLGFLTVKKRDAVLALLQKYGIIPEKSNVGHTIKAIATSLKTNDQFATELATLLLESEKKTASPAKKPSNFDGSADTVIQVAKDLKEAATIVNADEAGAEASAAAKKASDEKNKKMLLYFLIALAIIAAIFFFRNHFKTT